MFPLYPRFDLELTFVQLCVHRPWSLDGVHVNLKRSSTTVTKRLRNQEDDEKHVGIATEHKDAH